MATDSQDLIARIVELLATSPMPSEVSFVESGKTYSVGGVLTITAPTLTFSSFSASGTSPNHYTGTVTITAASVAIGSLLVAQDLSATYALSDDAADAGDLTLTATDVTLTLSDLATVDAASISIASRLDGTLRELRIGAEDVTATVGNASGPRMTLTGGSLALLTRRDGSADPVMALLATGNVALAGVTGATFTGTGWHFGYNEIDGLAAAPVTVSTGTGSVTLDLADGAHTLDGAGTLTLAGLGSLSGTFAISPTSGTLTVVATDVAASLTAGGAGLGLLHGTGGLTFAAGGVTGTGPGHLALTGDVSLTGVPGLAAAGTINLAVDTAASTFSFAGTGTISIGGVIDLGGSLAVTATGTGANRTVSVAVTSTSPSASGTITLKADGSYSRVRHRGPGPAGADPRCVLQRHGLDGGRQRCGDLHAHGRGPRAHDPGRHRPGRGHHQQGRRVLTITQTASTSDTPVTFFFGDTRGTDAITDDIGLSLVLSHFTALVLPDGALVLRVSGAAALRNVTGVTLGGEFAAAYNPTAVDRVLDGSTIAAQTVSVSGSGVALSLPGVTFTGSLGFVKQGTGDTATLTIDATDLTGVVGTATGTHLALTGGTLHLVKDKDGYTGTAGGAVALVGAPAGIAVSGGLDVAFDATTTTVTVTGLELTLPGFVAAGTATITSTTTTVTVSIDAATPASLDVADGLVHATGIHGTVTLGSGTPVVDLSAASVTVALPGLTISGPLTATSGSGFTLGATGNAATITVAGQSVTGVFAVTRSGGTTTITASNVGLALGRSPPSPAAAARSPSAPRV